MYQKLIAISSFIKKVVTITILSFVIISFLLLYKFFFLNPIIQLNYHVIMINYFISFIIASFFLLSSSSFAKLPTHKETKWITMISILLFNFAFIPVELTLIRRNIDILFNIPILNYILHTSFLFTIFNAIVLLLFSLFLIKKIDGFKLKDLDIQRKKFFSGYKWTLLIWLTFFLLQILFSAISHNGIQLSIDKSFVPRFLDFIKFLFFVGITEEIIYRGYLLNQLRIKIQKKLNSGIGLALAIILTNFLFSITHILIYLDKGVPMDALVGVFLIGAMLSITYLMTGNIFLVSGIHGLIDFDSNNKVLYAFIMLVIIMIYYFQKKENSNIIDSTKMSIPRESLD